MEKKENISWDLIAKFLAKESSETENSLVKHWIESDSNNREEFEKIKKSLNLIGLIEDTGEINVESSLKEVKNKFSKPSDKPSLNRRYLLKIAASVLILISIGIGTLYLNKSRFVEIYSGTRDNLIETLPDGSTVYLNANTFFKYPRKFDKNQRIVELSGEAYFEVTPDKTKPFVVDAGKSLIKVLGTSFNVKAYKYCNKTTVSVNSGLVEVYNKNILGTEDEGLLLEKGTQGTLLKTDNKINKSKIENQNYLSWKTKKIDFTDTPLSEVADILQSVYQIRIHFVNEELKGLPLTASFEKEDLKTVMHVIEITFGIEMLNNENEILLKKK